VQRSSNRALAAKKTTFGQRKPIFLRTSLTRELLLQKKPCGVYAVNLSRDEKYDGCRICGKEGFRPVFSKAAV